MSRREYLFLNLMVALLFVAFSICAATRILELWGL